MSETSRIVLAYSGGLDTSIILRWLRQTYACEVYAFTADLGQGGEVEAASAKARELGAADVFVEDLREEFTRDFVFPMLRANALYEGEYLLGTAIARPLIAKRLVEIADRVGADAVAHGATGKGNDQVRFELGAYALKPEVRIIAPWREWDLHSRSQLLAYAERHGIPVDREPGGGSPYSMDANLLHVSYEGGVLEDPWAPPDAAMWRRTTAPEAAPGEPAYLEIGFAHGDAVALDGAPLAPAALLQKLNEVAGAHGVGRVDIVENRYLGIKSRGCYETPGGTVLAKAHRAMESLTLDREAAHLKDSLMPRYAELVYNGYWWSAERALLQKLIDESQARVAGIVRVKLYKGCVTVLGRRSPNSLLDRDLASFETGTGEERGLFDARDAEGFIRLNALRLRARARGRDG